MCKDCLVGISKNDNKFIKKSNIEEIVEYYYNLEFRFHNSGFTEIEPTYDSIISDSSLFFFYNFCPICGKQISF